MNKSSLFKRNILFIFFFLMSYIYFNISYAGGVAIKKQIIFISFNYSETENLTYRSANGKILGSKKHSLKGTQGFLVRQRGGKLYIAFPDSDAVIVNNRYAKSSGLIAAPGKKECVKIAEEAGASMVACASYEYRNDNLVVVQIQNAFTDENGEGVATLSFRFDGRKCEFVRYTEKNHLRDYYAPFLPGPSGGGSYDRVEQEITRKATSGKCSLK